MSPRPRPKDRLFSRYIGPDSHGICRDDRVEFVDAFWVGSSQWWRVRLADGSVTDVHEDHLTGVWS